jgi:CopG family nickel-responsive transcriptional regulator
MSMVRFGVSLPEELIKQFDALINRKNYQNRSEAIRDLIRNDLIQDAITSNEPMVGVLSLIYDHHKRELQDKLTEMQHDHVESMVSSMHVHLDHENCLEVIIIRGIASRIKQLADHMIATKGIKHGNLYLTTGNKEIS